MGAATGRFKRSERLLDSRDFRRVMRRGSRLTHPDLVVLALERAKKPIENSGLGTECSTGSSRLGITASRKVGNSVRRNHFKRRVREWFRHHRLELDPAVDLVIIARRSGAQLDMQDLDERLCELLGLKSARG